MDALNHISFVGLQEAYDVSVKLLLRELGHANLTVEVKKERDQSSQTSARLAIEKRALVTNETLMARTRALNKYDLDLYALGKKYPFVHSMSYFYSKLLSGFARLSRDTRTCG